MTLRFALQAGVVLVAALLIALAVRLTVIVHVQEVERRQAAVAVERAHGEILAQAERIRSLARDWSLWDDAYAHALGERPEFAVELDQVVLDENDLAFIAITGLDGRPRSWAARIAGVPATFAALLEPGLGPWAPLIALPELDSQSTLLTDTEHGLVLAAAFPARTGQGGGPAAGAVLMGVHIDKNLLAMIGARSGGLAFIDGRTATGLEVQGLDGGRIRASMPIAIPGRSSVLHLDSSRDLIAGTLIALAWAVLATIVIGIIAALLLSRLRDHGGHRVAGLAALAGALLAGAMTVAAWRADDPSDGHHLGQVAGLGALLTAITGLAGWVGLMLARERSRQRTAAETAVAEERARIQAALFAHLPLLAWHTDGNGCYTAVNRAFARAMGYDDPADLIGRRSDDLGEAPGTTGLHAGDVRVRASDEPLHLRQHVVTADGERWYETVRVPHRGKDGDAGILGFALDVSRQQADEDERRIAAERTALAAKAAAVGTWEYLPKEDRLAWDDQMASLHGCPQGTGATLAGWLACMPEEDRERVAATFSAFLSQAVPFEVEARVCRAEDGAIRRIRTAAVALRDEDGTARRAVGACWDVTNEREHAESLATAMRAAQAADQAKSAFLATMSHEIRTPLNGILGTTALILDSRLTPDQRDMALMTRASAESLLALINDILDLSRIDAGRIDLERIAFDLQEVVDASIATLAARAQEKGLRLVVHLGTGSRFRRIGDPTRLRQILLNLLGNAIKFTDRGRVWVHLRSDDPHGVSVTVGDTGIGIPSDRIPHLFQPFSQADTSMARRFGGSGLGLAIVRRLAEAMGGTVEVASTPGMGSQFTVRLPIPADVGPGSVGTAIKARVLVIEPDPEARIGLASQIAAAGGMPVDSGPADLVLLSAAAEMWTGPERVIRMLPMGHPAIGEGSIAVPISGARLRDLLAGTQTPGPTREDEIAPSPAGRRILVAEDHPVNQRVVRAMLERLGHQVRIAADGEAVLIALREAPADLVLMDCQMPGMDGFTATRRIRAGDVPDPSIPIIALTANAMTGDREACLDAGMDDYVAKPVTVAALARIIAQWNRRS